MDGPIRVTLRRIERFAAFCGRFRPAAIASGIAATVWLLITVMGSTTESAWSLLALSLLLWSVITLGAGYGLTRLPRPAEFSEGLLRWLWQWIALGAFACGAICLLALAGFAAFLTIRALDLIFG